MTSSVFNMSNEFRGIKGAWQGGPCPKCGDDMPANVVHCMTCRALLNTELTEDSVEIPAFVPLPEIREMKTAKARGHFVRCGGCQESSESTRNTWGRQCSVGTATTVLNTTKMSNVLRCMPPALIAPRKFVQAPSLSDRMSPAGFVRVR